MDGLCISMYKHAEPEHGEGIPRCAQDYLMHSDRHGVSTM